MDTGSKIFGVVSVTIDCQSIDELIKLIVRQKDVITAYMCKFLWEGAEGAASSKASMLSFRIRGYLTTRLVLARVSYPTHARFRLEIVSLS